MMKVKLRGLTAGAAAVAAAVGIGVLLGGGAALADGTTPPWESKVSPNGYIQFYNSAGQVVTGGSITDSGLGAYAVASSADGRSGDTKATLYVYTPVAGENPALWSGEQISSSTTYPDNSAPPPIGTTTNPVESNSGSDQTLQSYITAFPNTATATGYPNLYDVRMKVSGQSIGQEPQYWDTVISVDTGTMTWSVDYPAATPPNWEPVLFGTSKVGSTDSCLAAFTGADTVTYAWQSNGSAIGGATSSTFKIPASQLGKTLTCSVQATNSNGSVSGTSAGATVVLGAPLVPTAKPVISGPHTTGKAEKVTAGTWSPAATKITYQWFIGSTKVAGATKSSFTVPSSAKGKTVHCVVTASATGYANGTYTTPSVKIT